MIYLNFLIVGFKKKNFIRQNIVHLLNNYLVSIKLFKFKFNCFHRLKNLLFFVKQVLIYRNLEFIIYN